MVLHTERARYRASILLVVAVGAAACSETDPHALEEAPLFTLLPSSETGVTFVNSLDEDPVMNGLTYEYYYNGGGVAVGDLNGDGLPDLYLTGNRVPNRLYLNRGGMRFDDVSEQAGVRGHPGWATGVAFTDVNGDGRLDIHVSYSGAYDDPDLRRNQLFINQGVRDGVPAFTEESEAYGLDDRGLSTQAAFFDYDGDGDLDMYLLNHGVAGYHDLAELKAQRSPYQVDRLYRNDGGSFVDVSPEVGLIDTNLGFGLGVSVGDLDNDGRPDIYVANDYSGRDYLYLGRADGRFDEALEGSMPHIPFASMGSDMGDLDGDGWLDLVVLEMAMDDHYDRAVSSGSTDNTRFATVVREGQHYQYVTNTLQWNRGVDRRGVPRFSDIAHLAGVASTDWSWAPLFADFDNDGRPDLFITTGTPGDLIHRDFQEYWQLRLDEVVEGEDRVTHSLMRELLEELPSREVPNRVFRNEGDLTFSDHTDAWGLDRPGYSNGAVYADLDRDGDLDLVVNNLMGEASVYRNETAERGDGHMLGVRLRGPDANPMGVGARVRVHAGGHAQVQELQLTRGYQSSVEPVLHFGLGSHHAVDTLEVLWPDGSRQVRTDVEGDRYVTLDRQDARAPQSAPAVAPLFDEAPRALQPGARHHASVATVDSGLATYPSVRDAVALTAGDVDGDGLDDFIFGGSDSEPSRVYLQAEDGTFRGAPLPGPAVELGATTAAALLDADGDGRPDLWLVHEDPRAGAGAYRHRLLVNIGDGRFRQTDTADLPALADAGSVLAVGDYDGDGDDDLFVGARSVPPSGAPAASRLLRNDSGTFEDATAEAAPDLEELTTVTDAVWTDVDGDGAADLIVVGEWMPVRVWLGDGDSLREVTDTAGLDRLTGWWQTIVAADFDGDGDMDLVAGNMGLNYPYHPTPERPFELYIGDFDADGVDEAVPGYHQSGQLYPWRDRDELGSAIPSVLDRYPRHHLFARATLPELLGPDRLDSARRLEVATLATMYLENDGGGRFTSHPLPTAAQISAVTGAVPADFDGDGRLDLVVAGNLFELSPPVPRADAGVGLFLRGDGTGGFRPVTPVESGLLLDGPVRRLAAIGSGSGSPPGLLVAVTGGAARYVRTSPGRGVAADREDRDGVAPRSGEAR